MKRDLRKKRKPVYRNRRKHPYVYTYEVNEAAKELGVSKQQLQSFINDRVEDIQSY